MTDSQNNTPMMAHPEAWVAQVVSRFGPLIGGSDLRQLLGFRTASAMQRAMRKGLLSAPVFALEGRRGLFAITAEVATWIVKQRHQG